MRRAPFTLALIALAFVATALPADSCAHLVASREALARGQLWRLLTGPLVHASLAHLLWDGALLLAVGLAFERRFGRAWAAILVGGLVVPVAAVALFQPDVATYYGMSGATYAALGAAIVSELSHGPRRPAIVALAVFVAAKLAWNFAGPGPLVTLTEGVRVVPLAHLFGVIAGGLSGTCRP